MLDGLKARQACAVGVVVAIILLGPLYLAKRTIAGSAPAVAHAIAESIRAESLELDSEAGDLMITNGEAVLSFTVPVREHGNIIGQIVDVIDAADMPYLAQPFSVDVLRKIASELKNGEPIDEQDPRMRPDKQNGESKATEPEAKLEYARKAIKPIYFGARTKLTKPRESGPLDHVVRLSPFEFESPSTRKLAEISEDSILLLEDAVHDLTKAIVKKMSDPRVDLGELVNLSTVCCRRSRAAYVFTVSLRDCSDDFDILGARFRRIQRSAIYAVEQVAQDESISKETLEILESYLESMNRRLTALG